MQNYLKTLIRVGKDRGYSYVRGVIFTMQKTVYIYNNGKETCEEIIEKWLLLVGIKKDRKYRLNITYDETMPPEFYFEFFNKKIGSIESACSNGFYKGISEFHDSENVNMLSNKVNNILHLKIEQVKYTVIQMTRLLCDTDYKIKKYRTIECCFECFSKFPKMYGLNVKGYNLEDLIREINSDYVTKGYFAYHKQKKLHGRIKLKIKAIYQIFNLLLNYFNAEAVVNRSSMFTIEDFANQRKILSNRISIVELPRFTQFKNRYEFDDEGIKGYKKILVDKGRLSSCFGSEAISEQYDFVKAGNSYRDTEQTDFLLCRQTNERIIVSNKVKNIYDFELLGFQEDFCLTVTGQLMGTAIVTDSEKANTYTLSMSFEDFFKDCYASSKDKIYLNLISPEIIVHLSEENGVYHDSNGKCLF